MLSDSKTIATYYSIKVLINWPLKEQIFGIRALKFEKHEFLFLNDVFAAAAVVAAKRLSK